MKQSDELPGMSIAEVFARGGPSRSFARTTRGSPAGSACANTRRRGGRPAGLQVFQNCANLIRTLPMLTFDEPLRRGRERRLRGPRAGGAALRADVEPAGAREQQRPAARVYDPIATGEPHADGLTRL
jgi:hypothetical protein